MSFEKFFIFAKRDKFDKSLLTAKKEKEKNNCGNDSGDCFDVFIFVYQIF